MYKPLGYLLFPLLLMLVIQPLEGQKRTFSPFSRYGLGELETRELGQSQGMGGTGIGMRSNEHLNNLNPASYSAMDSLSFFMEAGITGFTQTFKSFMGKETYNDMDFNYFAMGFPVTQKVFVSLGLQPYSNAGYNFEYTANTALNKAIGTGNLTSVYGGIAIKPIRSLSLGAHATYLFGNLQHTTFVEFIDNPTAFKYGVQTEIHASDFFFDLGAQYSIKINKSNTLIFGLTFQPQTSISGDYQKTAAKGMVYAQDGKLFQSNILIPEASDTSNVKGFDLPDAFGAGVSYNWNNRLVVAADYSTQKWGDAGLMENLSSVTTSNKFSAGAEFIPDERSQSYLGMIRYRVGVRYLEDYIKLNNHQVKDLGISFGVGLPLSRTKTSVNVAFEVGKRGTSERSQLEETYGKLKINFTFYEIWFRQRKFD